MTGELLPMDSYKSVVGRGDLILLLLLVHYNNMSVSVLDYWLIVGNVVAITTYFKL